MLYAQRVLFGTLHSAYVWMYHILSLASDRELGSWLSIPSRGTRRLLCSYTLLRPAALRSYEPFLVVHYGKMGRAC